VISGTASRAAGSGAARSDRPSAGFLGAACDDYVVRVSLPGAVVHDCTVGQARAFEHELSDVIAAAERAETRDRRVRR
jgi:hypothetical protein